LLSLKKSLNTSYRTEVNLMASPKPKSYQETPRGHEEKPAPQSGILKKFDPSVLDRPQGPDSGLNAVMGKWPGDETDEEILALLEKLS
jgi:hypothetical protein